MSFSYYDNWERRVESVLRREQYRQLALAHSSFNFGRDSPVHEQSLQLEAYSSKVNEMDWDRLLPIIYGEQ